MIRSRPYSSRKFTYAVYPGRAPHGIVTTREQTTGIIEQRRIPRNSKLIAFLFQRRPLPFNRIEHMTEQTVVAVYDRRADADAAVRDLAAQACRQGLSAGTRTAPKRRRRVLLREKKGSGHVFSAASRTTTLRSMIAASTADHPS